MQNFIFSIPSMFKHVFVVYSPKCPTYYTDKHLENPILDFSSCFSVKTMVPDNLSKIEVLNVENSILDGTISTCIDKLSLWPYQHMVNAEVIIDGTASFSYSLLNNSMKAKYREEMEQNSWDKSLLIVYTKNDGNKIGFLLFR